MTTGSATGAFVAFVVAGAVIVLLLFGMAVGLGALSDKTLAGLRGQGPNFKRWAGFVLTVLGTWFLVLAIWSDFFADIFPV